MMKKFEIKMFDVNSKRRSVIIADESLEGCIKKLKRFLPDRMSAGWINDFDETQWINLSNIVEITSIEEAKE
ncbi:hypothetical protein N0K73_05360 [Dellaglioa algida]|uniref:hypothetical protein n=1 Tax=Dellaglioa algida TaxID=105612 RepID=UPI0024C4CD4B|nr:hypothetical protein [Dellaglioa algida]MDK1718699.1 hypothetical protein [Dellaglioa algida]